MAKIQNINFKGVKGAVIGSCLVDYDSDGIADVSDEIASAVKKIPGFSIVSAPVFSPVNEREPVIVLATPALMPSEILETESADVASDSAIVEPETEKVKRGRPRTSR